MDSITQFFWHDGKFLGHAWTNREIFWNLIGWGGQAVFFSRFFVQWYATEKKKQVVVPAAFWWLSIIGSLLLLLYATLYDKHYVIIFAYAFNWIPYIRNLVIHSRHKAAHLDCPACNEVCPPKSNFCLHCGARLPEASTPA
jgi:lipid-A-disaccharide synthase-like uncharacterized protein